MSATIRIHSAGHITVQEGPLRFEYNKGFVVRLKSYAESLPVAKWLAEVRGSIFREIGWGDKIAPQPIPTKTFEEMMRDNLWEDHARYYYPSFTLKDIIGWLLGSIVSNGHGGALAILGAGWRTNHVTFGYRCTSELRESVCKAWTAFMSREKARWEYGKYHKEVAENIPSILPLCFEPADITALTSAIDGLSSAANLDGVVAVDRDARVCGINGVITARIGDDNVAVHNLTTRQNVTAGELLRGKGTRHRSALALCAAIPNTIVFVISQDGSLRLFASEDGKLYFDDLLSTDSDW